MDSENNSTMKSLTPPERPWFVGQPRNEWENAASQSEQQPAGPQVISLYLYSSLYLLWICICICIHIQNNNQPVPRWFLHHRHHLFIFIIRPTSSSTSLFIFIALFLYVERHIFLPYLPFSFNQACFFNPICQALAAPLIIPPHFLLKLR